MTYAQFKVMVVNPPRVQVKDFYLVKGLDLFSTISDLRAEYKP